MKCWNTCIKAQNIILEYVLHNVAISYDKIRYKILTYCPYQTLFLQITPIYRKHDKNEICNETLTMAKHYKNVMNIYLCLSKNSHVSM